MANPYTLAALAALALTASPAFARPAQPELDPLRQMVVPYADLDLSSAKDQAILADRIHKAADSVCGPEPDLREVSRYAPYRSCMKEATDAATAAMSVATQTAKGRAGGPPETKFTAPR